MSKVIIRLIGNDSIRNESGFDIYYTRNYKTFTPLRHGITTYYGESELYVTDENKDTILVLKRYADYSSTWYVARLGVFYNEILINSIDRNFSTAITITEPLISQESTCTKTTAHLTPPNS